MCVSLECRLRSKCTIRRLIEHFSLSADVQARIQQRIDALGLQLETFHHYRMTESEDYRLRIGDYRVIYNFDLEKNILYLWNVGHRREGYRSRS